MTPSIASQLKPHQMEGVRFLWRNIVTEHEETAAVAAAAAGSGGAGGSGRKKSSDSDDDFEGDAEGEREDLAGGCILAHSMGLGKTMQVITLLHTMMARDR